MPWKGKPFGWGVPQPYIGYLPEPTDATVNMLRQVSANVAQNDDMQEGGSIKIKVNYLEVPSVFLAIDLQFRALNVPMRVIVKTGKVPKPDPRKPGGRVKHLLWKYRFKTAKPALAPPSDGRIVETVAELALQPYDYQANWDQARSAARHLQADSVRDILATMVHPPPIQDGSPSWVWLPRVQLAAAQLSAHLDRGWNGSIRKQALLDVAAGPIDWTTEAAIVAVAQLARDTKEAAADVRGLFAQLLERAPREGHCCYFTALCHNWLLLPELPSAERKQVEEMLAMWESS
jgi:hypothetical protein